jgi:isoleucyl-tRNA synthetase
MCEMFCFRCKDTIIFRNDQTFFVFLQNKIWWFQDYCYIKTNYYLTVQTRVDTNELLKGTRLST